MSDIFGNIVGNGSGAGLALMIIFGGIISIITVLIGFLNRNIRNIEKILRDHAGVT